MRRAAGVCLVGLPFALLLGSPVAHAQPLKDELARLLVTHPQIKAARKLLQAGEARQDEAFGEFLPRAEFTGETGPEAL